MLVDLEEIEGAKITVGTDGMSGTRVALAPWDQWKVAVGELVGSVVVVGNQSRIFQPARWPGLPQLIVDSVDVVGHGRQLKSTWGDGPKFEKAKLTVGYKTVDFDPKENKNDPNPDNTVWFTQSLDYSVEVFSIDVKVKTQVKQNDGSTKPSEKTVKHFKRVPTITYVLTGNKIYAPPFAAMQSLVGKINKYAILGAPPVTVLFDGPNMEREITAMTVPTWKVTYKFIYKPMGWNNTFHPETLEVVPMVAIAAQNEPYEMGDFTQLFPRARFK